ncbi:MAG: hypothetical protein AAF242_13370, partial [Bacteroidota bacterium]
EETHQIQTDQQGYFSIEIGDGENNIGQWGEIPWASKDLWLEVFYTIENSPQSYLISKNQMMAVPYAFVANTTSRINRGKDLALREDSDNWWNTSGNYKSIPHAHYVGTRDFLSFFIKTNDSTRIVIEDKGRVTFYAEPSDNPDFTDDDEREAYAYVVEGEEQGIYIEVNAKERSLDNNYLTFADNQNIHGTIEGQTLKQLMGSFDYIYTNILNALDVVLGTAASAAEFTQGVGYTGAAGASGASLIFAWKGPGYGIAAGADVVLGGLGVADVVKTIAEGVEFLIRQHNTVGVTYTSGGADYAEYIKRGATERDMVAGEVVGIKNGLLTLNTDQADHYMVISGRPIILGNTPSPEREDLFEQVAFLGQSFINVSGDVASGDYLIPSGNHDGLAIAYHPDEIPTALIKKIIGTAMEGVQGEPGEIHLINSSIGLSKNVLAYRTDALEQKVDHILAYLEGKVDAPQLEGSLNDKSNPIAASVDLSNDEQLVEGLKQVLGEQQWVLDTYFTTLELKMQEQGVELREIPMWREILDNPTEAIITLRNHPMLKEKWKYVDQKLIETIKPTKVGDE